MHPPGSCTPGEADVGCGFQPPVDQEISQQEEVAVGWAALGGTAGDYRGFNRGCRRPWGAATIGCGLAVQRDPGGL